MKLRYERVSKVYPNAAKPAVNDISLAVPEGRFVVFLGPSGCGKTTLLKMTNRLIEPTGGEILLDGSDIRQVEVNGLRRRIGYVIQQVGLFPHMNVADNVATVPSLLKWPQARIRQRVDELLDLVGLSPGEYRSRYPAQLSGGQQQRVGLARALAADPELMLMDEPFGAVDAITRANLQDEMLHMHRRLKKTILFVTHDVDEALRLADEIAVLRAGQLVQYGLPCELLSRPVNDFVRDLMGSDDRVRQLGQVRVDAVMRPLPVHAGAGTQPDSDPAAASLPLDSNLRNALDLFLQRGVERVVVVDDGRPVGEITFDDLREAGCHDRGPDDLPAQ